MGKSAISPQDEIWSLIKEAQREMKELRAGYKEAQQEMKELRASQKELQSSQKKTDKQIKKAQNLFTTQWGRLMESLVEGDLVKLLKEKGIKLERTSTNEKGWMSWTDEKGVRQKKQCEIDIVAKNGEKIVVVEVKTTLTVRDVRKFVDILNKFTQLLPEYGDKKVYGAVAFLRADDGSEIYSEKQGLFVIKATGSSSSITNKKGFKPKAFS